MWFISIDQHSCFIAPDVTGLPTIPENVSFLCFLFYWYEFYFGLTIEVFLGREIEYIVTVCVCEEKNEKIKNNGVGLL